MKRVDDGCVSTMMPEMYDIYIITAGRMQFFISDAFSPNEARAE